MSIGFGEALSIVQFGLKLIEQIEAAGEQLDFMRSRMENICVRLTRAREIVTSPAEESRLKELSPITFENTKKVVAALEIDVEKVNEILEPWIKKEVGVNGIILKGVTFRFSKVADFFNGVLKGGDDKLDSLDKRLAMHEGQLAWCLDDMQYQGIKELLRRSAAQQQSANPATKPAQPAAKPAKKPVQKPADPVQPVQPATKPAQPVAKPAQPTPKSTQPASKPTQPTSHPVQPATKPTQQAAKPPQPTSKPTQQSPKPTQPALKPTPPPPPTSTQPTQKPSQAAQKPSQATHKPTQPTAKLTQPTPKPTQPTPKTTHSIPKPGQPTTKPPQITPKPPIQTPPHPKPSPTATPPPPPHPPRKVIFIDKFNTDRSVIAHTYLLLLQQWTLRTRNPFPLTHITSAGYILRHRSALLPTLTSLPQVSGDKWVQPGDVPPNSHAVNALFNQRYFAYPYKVALYATALRRVSRGLPRDLFEGYDVIFVFTTIDKAILTALRDALDASAPEKRKQHARAKIVLLGEYGPNKGGDAQIRAVKRKEGMTDAEEVKAWETQVLGAIKTSVKRWLEREAGWKAPERKDAWMQEYEVGADLGHLWDGGVGGSEGGGRVGA